MRSRRLAPLMLIIGLLAAMVGVVAAPARPAYAANTIELTYDAWTPDEIWVGEESTLTFELRSLDALVNNVTVTVNLPAGATRTSAVTSDNCSSISTDADTSLIKFTLNVPDSRDYCDLTVTAKFETAGDYSTSDFTADTNAASEDVTTFWQPALTVLDATVIAFAMFAPYDISLFENETTGLGVSFVTDYQPGESFVYTMTFSLPAGVTINTDLSSIELYSECTLKSVSQSGRNVTVVGETLGGEDGACEPYLEASFAGPGLYTIEPGADVAIAGITVSGSDVGGAVATSVTVLALPAPPTPTPGPQAPFCTELPDLAVSPQFIEIAPGERATVELTMRNLCPDRPFDDSDLLISFSDGLSVVETTGGMVGMGQRAADQRFSLAAGETKRWTVTVEAGASLATAPVHITEHFVTGYAPRRIGGVFITPAPAPAAAPAAPAPTAAPLPVTLPNTAGAGSELLMLAAALGLVAAGSTVLRRR